MARNSNSPCRGDHYVSLGGVVVLLSGVICAAPVAPLKAQQTQANGVPAQAQNGGDSGEPSPLKRGNLVTTGVTFAPSAGFDKGQSLRYGTQMTMVLRMPAKTGGRADFVFSPTMDTVLQYRVHASKADGETTMSVLSEGGRFANPTGGFDRLAKEPESARRTLTLDRLSRLIAFKEPAGHKASNTLDALFNDANLVVPLHILPLPDHEIKVGESWSALYAAPGRAIGESPEGTNVRATLTLLGIEKFGEVPTIKLRQVMTVPFAAYTDAQGKPTTQRAAKGRMQMTLTFTQVVNALPTTGLLVRSEGTITGNIRFEGALLAQLPGNLMTISGNLIAVRLDDSPPADPPK